jgi:hypothetical protein
MWLVVRNDACNVEERAANVRLGRLDAAHAGNRRAYEGSAKRERQDDAHVDRQA